MEDPARQAIRWRARAQQFRALAQSPDNASSLKHTLLRLAEEWEQMAIEAEARMDIYERLRGLASRGRSRREDGSGNP